MCAATTTTTAKRPRVRRATQFASTRLDVSIGMQHTGRRRRRQQEAELDSVCRHARRLSTAHALAHMRAARRSFDRSAARPPARSARPFSRPTGRCRRHESPNERRWRRWCQPAARPALGWPRRDLRAPDRTPRRRRRRTDAGVAVWPFDQPTHAAHTHTYTPIASTSQRTRARTDRAPSSARACFSCRRARPPGSPAVRLLVCCRRRRRQGSPLSLAAVAAVAAGREGSCNAANRKTNSPPPPPPERSTVARRRSRARAVVVVAAAAPNGSCDEHAPCRDRLHRRPAGQCDAT